MSEKPSGLACGIGHDVVERLDPKWRRLLDREGTQALHAAIRAVVDEHVGPIRLVLHGLPPDTGK